MKLELKYLETNSARYARGAAHHKFEVTLNDYCETLWMTNDNVRDNINLFPDLKAELEKAL